MMQPTTLGATIVGSDLPTGAPNGQGWLEAMVNHGMIDDVPVH